MPTANAFAHDLARAFRAGDWSLDGLHRRGIEACGGRKRGLRALVRRVLAAFPGPVPADEAALATFLDDDPVLDSFGKSYRRIAWDAPRMEPRPSLPFTTELPPLTTTTALAEWLGLSPAQLDWFASASWKARKAGEAAGHYTQRWLAKRTGGKRLLEVPKARLKTLQRQVLHEILDRVPPHEAAHGYRRGRSVVGYVTPHAGRQFVLRLDLRDFFPSIRAARVHALFQGVGYPRDVARVLARLCTTVMPDWLREKHRDSGIKWTLFEARHLPQGAPTSPALANLCSFRLDCRLAGLAHSVGAAYTRYADDLAFSGGELLERSARRFQVLVCRIALEEGFEVHTRKTRFMRQGVRQHLAGVVVNVRPNIRREGYERLKATLWNCVRHGPQEQNRAGVADFRGHLRGRIAHLTAIHPVRGERLLQLFARISWD